MFLRSSPCATGTRPEADGRPRQPFRRLLSAKIQKPPVSSAGLPVSSASPPHLQPARTEDQRPPAGSGEGPCRRLHTRSPSPTFLRKCLSPALPPSAISAQVFIVQSSASRQLRASVYRAVFRFPSVPRKDCEPILPSSPVPRKGCDTRSHRPAIQCNGFKSPSRRPARPMPARRCRLPDSIQGRPTITPQKARHFITNK